MMADKEKLLKTLKELGDEAFEDFKWHLQQPDILEGFSTIPKCDLEKACRRDTVDEIVQTYNHQAVEVVKKILKTMNKNDVVEKLSAHVEEIQQSLRSGSLSTDELFPAQCSSLVSILPSSGKHPDVNDLKKNSASDEALQRPLPEVKASNKAQTYEDIISKSIQMSSGSPDVYQLRPKEEKFGTLTRKTVGEKNLNKKNKSILLVGETGTGKSILINALVNYTMGVKFENNIWFEIVEEEKRSQSESQTSDVIVYQIFGFEDKTLPFSLTIIDTPGYGDIRGIERDVIISQRLFDLFRSKDEVHEIDAVGLVLQAGVNRVSDRQKYIFDSVTSLFGKDIEKNIVALITHSDGITPEDALKALKAANTKGAKNEKNQLVHFLFNNRQNKQRTEETKVALENAWRVTERGMKRFTDFLEKSKPQQLITTVEVLKARIRITACIQNLQDRIQLIELKQNKIQQTEEALKKHEQEMKKNKEFTVEVDEVYKKKEKIDGGRWLFFYKGAVTCNICKETCHYPGCTKAWYPEHCEVMKDGYCTVCTRKCRAEDHVKEKWRYVNKIRKVKKTLEDVKQKYEKNKVDREQKKSLLENLQTEMEELKSEKIQLLTEVYQHVEQLEQIALNDSSWSTHVHLDFLIEKMNEIKATEKVKKLEEMKRREDERTKAAMRYYMFGR
ncbi:golgin subfamily A member 6-like protein 25 [Thunnus thynnus]|uniref:golgin subfamily A member 6-like protein 25 n=1 Tax=Thunnus thynnus TaxID=8237 RepID=UPI003529B242